MNITIAEAMTFAVAVHEAVNATNPVMPSLVIMKTAVRVDFKGDIDLQVRRIIGELMGIA